MTQQSGHDSDSLLLRNVFPHAYDLLQQHLPVVYPELLKQLPFLSITTRCGCHTDGCATIQFRKLNKFIHHNHYYEDESPTIDFDKIPGIFLLDVDEQGRIWQLEMFGVIKNARQKLIELGIPVYSAISET